MAEPVIQAIDMVGLTHYRLYREHHRLEKDLHLKDLDFLNRDLSKVIVLENDLERLKTHPENGLYLKSWQGEPSDDELGKYVDLLQEMAIWAISKKENDLRPILQSVKELDSTNIPNGWKLFKEKQSSSANSIETTKEPTSLWQQASTVAKLLVGGEIMHKTSQFGKVDSIQQLEQTSKLLKQNIKHEFERFEELEKKMVAEHLAQIEKHKAELAEAEYTLIDYLTGNVPQPGQPANE